MSRAPQVSREAFRDGLNAAAVSPVRAKSPTCPCADDPRGCTDNQRSGTVRRPGAVQGRATLIRLTTFQRRGVDMRMKALIIVLLAPVVGLLAPATADAATGVTINRIMVAPIAAGSKVTVRPALTVRGEVRIAKKYVTIWSAAGEKIVSKKMSAKLGTGTYTVKTVGSDVQWVWVTFEDGVAADTAWIE